MLENGDPIPTTGFVLQELLQGFTGPKARGQIIERFSALPLLVPERQDHIDAAELRNVCRRHGVQAGTVDMLFAQLCIRHNLLMLRSDNDFQDDTDLADLSLIVHSAIFSDPSDHCLRSDAQSSAHDASFAF
jgi:predicted nucleic acid-binding protein